MGGSIRMDLDAIHHSALGEIVERPEQVRLINSIHRGAKTLAIAQHPNFHISLGHRLRDSGHQMDLRPDEPATSRFGPLQDVDDVLRAPGEISQIYDFLGTFGVNDDRAVGMFGACCGDMFRSEESMNAAVTGPEHDLRSPIGILFAPAVLL